ncbi:C6 transcription factor [Pyrenophora tritici-repentis]|nr:C6 transcription factor [Pyrenophora tritici-repentis]
MFKNVVDRIEIQLERLEQGVTAVQTGLQRLQTAQGRYSHSANGAMSSWTCAAVGEGTAVSIPGSSHHGLRRRFVRDVDGHEFYIGPMSLLSLILDAKELVLESLERRKVLNKDEQTSFTIRLEAVATRATSSTLESDSGNMAPAMPPKAMLEAMFETYFEEVSPAFPLWTREGFRSQILSNRINETAWAISTNSMILLTLTAKYLRASSRKTTGSLREASFRESELAKPFAINARRAARVSGRLLAPTILNLQALISLCMIAPLHLPAGDLFRIFSQAQYVAQLLGLSCPRPELGAANLLTDAQWQERTNALRCLQDIAASIRWVTGMETSGFLKPSPSGERPDAFPEPTDATPLMNTTHDCTCSTALMKGLDHWYETSHRDLSKEQRPEELCKLAPDLTVKYHFLRSVLLHARLRNLEDARAACNASDEFLRALVVAWRSDHSLGLQHGLALQMVTYPVMVIARLIQTVQEYWIESRRICLIDLDLLRSVHSTVEALAFLSHTESHAALSAVLLEVLIDLATITQSDAASRHTVAALRATSESTDDIFHSLPDFLKDSSCNSSNVQSIDTYSLPENSIHLPYSNVSFDQHINPDCVEQMFALESLKGDDARADSWWNLTVT